MAVAFYDNFNRADGAPGADWVSDAGTFLIVSNELECPASGRLRYNGSLQGPNVCASIWVPEYGSATRVYGFRLRQNYAKTDYIAATVSILNLSITVGISIYVGGSLVTSTSKSQSLTSNAAMPFRVAAIGDQVFAWVNDYLILTVYQNDVPDNGSVVITNTTSGEHLDDFTLYDYGASAGLVDAVADEETPGQYTLTLHNIGPEWTPGTPGSPVFVCRAGTIISQTVDDADTATLVWQAPTILTTDEISDPGFESYYSLDLTAIAGAAPTGSGGGGLTPAQAETITDLGLYLGDYQDGGGSVSGLWVKLGAISILAGSAYSAGDGTALGDLFDAVLDTTNGLAANKNVTDLIYALLDATTQQGGYTLSSVQEAIRGTSSRDLTAVYNLIDALEVADPTDVTSILNAIAAIRTANMWSLDSVKTWIEAIDTGSNQDVLNELALIRTANNWSLGHVIDAIAAISVPDYSDQLDTIDTHILAIPTNPITSLQPALDAIAGVRGTGNPDLAAVLTAIAAIPTNPITDLSSVISAISTLSGHLDDKIDLVLDAIAAIVPGAGTPTAPVWPGLGNVTLGTPVAIDRTFSSSATCHGVIVAITGDSMARGTYDWGGVTQHYRAGYVSFATDRGDRADPQPFTFPSHVITVPNALQASGFIGKARAGVTGSVTPWTINVA